MKRLGFVLLTSLMVLATMGIVFWTNLHATADGPSDFTGQPPFIAGAVQPNVLLVMDNSGSMTERAICKNGQPCEAFDPTRKFSGFFQPDHCYTYDPANNRFEIPNNDPVKAFSALCLDPMWDGNFLNWITFRRFDAVKFALIGGDCHFDPLVASTGRDANGICIPSGSPAKKTIRGQTTFSDISSGHELATPATPQAIYTGRMPVSVASGAANIFFHLRGGISGMQGSFCVDDDATTPRKRDTDCTDADPFVESQFFMRAVVPHDTLGLPIEPKGVIQDLGDKARFGVMEFRGSDTDGDGRIDDGARVLTSIGGRQSINFSDNGLQTFNTNKSAMIASLEKSFPKTNTPLSEALLDSVTYIAQVNSFFSPSSYTYPVAFSGGGVVGLAQNGPGSLGDGNGVAGSAREISMLTGSETCPAGYITNACGRDPYFFGSNHNPSWASPSTLVPCCKTFIMLLTDGGPSSDQGIASPAVPNASQLQDFAAAVSGTRCTGAGPGFSLGPPAVANPITTCYDGTQTVGAVPGGPVTTSQEASILLHQHKTDYGSGLGAGSHFLDDIALWAHTTDLRQATIPVLNIPGHDLPEIQNVTLYTFFAFGKIDGRELLMQAARQGGFDDLNGNKIPDLPAEFDKLNNATGAAVPDGIPDTFFESQNVDDLKEKLLAAITSILQRAASGTSVSVLATSSTGEGAIYQAFFFPSLFNAIGTEVTWSGFVQGLFIDTFGNLREDFSSDCVRNANSTSPSFPDGILNLKHDCIIKIRFDSATNEVIVDRFQDVDGTGAADPPTPVATNVRLRDVHPIWEGGRRLALTDPGANCPADSGGVTCRRILTWADFSNGGGVNAGPIGSFGLEYGEFTAARVASFCPFLGGVAVSHCNSNNPATILASEVVPVDSTLPAGCVGITRQQCARNEATGIINFIRGCDEQDTALAYCTNVAGLRPRQLTFKDDAGAVVTKTWKLGDIINSTPVIVGAPRERFDVIYGDESYGRYFQRYKDRRQVAYVGANDGMLHAFNAGFLSLGDVLSTPQKEQLRITTEPNQPGTTTTCSALPCDGSVATYGLRSNTSSLKLGSELWAFIPQDLLPQLLWLTYGGYEHTYYVDLKPKLTDARIFPDDADHPGGWGTVLVGGFRLGGGCTNCQQGKAKPRVVTADFNNNGNTTDTCSSGCGAGSGADTRVFLSSYFVMDVTNPEKDPVLLWTLRDKDLGLTTAEPAVVRVSPTKTQNALEKWFVVFGTGPTHHDAEQNNPNQLGQMYVVDLQNGPNYAEVNRTSGTVGGTACSLTSPCIVVRQDSQFRAFSTGDPGFMGDAVALDFNLDFDVDAIYAGSVNCHFAGSPVSFCDGSNPKWKGAMHRLTTNRSTNLDLWGISSGPNRVPTKLLSRFVSSSSAATCPSNSCFVGPVTSKAALTSDDNSNVWVFFGSGRFFSNNDKVNQDLQYYFGVKDSFITQGSPAQTVERSNLFDSSNIVVCTVCDPASAGNNVSINGDTTASGFNMTFDSLIQQIQSQNMDGWVTTLLGPRERNLSPGTLIGGTLFFTTFEPVSDICKAAGDGFLYALYYQTGGPYTSSAIGTTTTGGVTTASRSIALGSGLPSQMAVQLGSQGTGASGTVSGSGCSGRITGFIQASTGVLGQTCGQAALEFWSRLLSWRDL